MTPKQKAKELFTKYESVSGLARFSKIYAEIAVDELIKCTHSDSRANSKFDKEYWEKVKLEINKL